MEAIYSNQILFLRVLKADGFDPSIHANLAIRMATAEGNMDVVKLLLADKNVDLSAKDAIAVASMNGQLEVLKLLIARGIDPSAGDNAAIRMASEFGHAKVVQLLLKDGRADPSARDNYAIKHASRFGHAEVVQLLVEDERVDPSVDDNFVIKCASIDGYENIVKRLLADHRVKLSLQEICRLEYEWMGHQPIQDLLSKRRHEAETMNQ